MEFYRDKKKSMNMILICVGLLVVFIGIFLYSIGLFDGQVGPKLAAVAGIFSIVLAVIILKKLFTLRDTSPLVIVSLEGIISQTTAVSKAAGLILWKDISDVHLEKVGADTLITLTVENPERYLPLIKKKLSSMFTNGLVTEDGNLPISLTASELDTDAQELYNVITNSRKKVG
ncbi:STM3941 family protein [Epilithonimonas lactis]|uniref:Uncharacterized protein n=1 Tax=Epilithonimonas lactis TaxID=421072 RepID=A0A085B953_9FLAO|nr:STM3941 family protein [Epilithonimonas lactis]KFC18998.1 hypothetical protein IO89_15875 [Epilithonimonas lactis]SEQ95721.1 hypothetical protein SAMN04488097_3518 [Epilithonimonas lactis]